MIENKGKNDPKFEDAKALLKEDGLVLSVNLLKKRLNVGEARAKLIFEALKPEIVHTPADDDLLGGSDSELPADSGSNQNPVQTNGDGNVDSSGHTGGQADDNQLGLPSQEGLPPVTSESPQESTVPTETPAELPTAPNVNSGAGRGAVIGQHPVTEEPVYENDNQ